MRVSNQREQVERERSMRTRQVSVVGHYGTLRATLPGFELSRLRFVVLIMDVKQVGLKGLTRYLVTPDPMVGPWGDNSAWVDAAMVTLD